MNKETLKNSGINTDSELLVTDTLSKAFWARAAAKVVDHIELGFDNARVVISAKITNLMAAVGNPDANADTKYGAWAEEDSTVTMLMVA